MKKITKYEANDKSLHDTEQEAAARDRLLELEIWYKSNKLYTDGTFSYCQEVSWSDLLEWIKEHKGQLQEILYGV